MKFIADFHIHSKYSRATSPQMEVEHLAYWAQRKGISLLGTGDFTHHLWLQELKTQLTPVDRTGLYVYKGIHFILSAEISSIFSQAGKVYRVHTIVLAPSFKIVEEINRMLSTYGNLASDGRPIIGISCQTLAEELMRISRDIMIVPAHIWTPWFSVFGASSGFDNLEDAFGPYTENITALETGLSSDPAMNWRLSQLDRFSLISNSDSHSPSRIGREANVFNCDLAYGEIKKVLETKDRSKFLYTVEFFPEEGKYHFDGHRNCKVRWHPNQTKKHKGICSVCKKPVTRGVLGRVDQLADRAYDFVPENAIPYKSMVPLDEIIADVKGVKKGAKQVEIAYTDLISHLGSELNILLNLEKKELYAHVPERIADAIIRVRDKSIQVMPGFDGEYGTITIFDQSVKQEKEQLTLF